MSLSFSPSLEYLLVGIRSSEIFGFFLKIHKNSDQMHLTVRSSQQCGDRSAGTQTETDTGDNVVMLKRSPNSADVISYLKWSARPGDGIIIGYKTYQLRCLIRQQPPPTESPPPPMAIRYDWSYGKANSSNFYSFFCWFRRRVINKYIIRLCIITERVFVILMLNLPLFVFMTAKFTWWWLDRLNAHRFHNNDNFTGAQVHSIQHSLLWDISCVRIKFEG